MDTKLSQARGELVKAICEAFNKRMDTMIDTCNRIVAGAENPVTIAAFQHHNKALEYAKVCLADEARIAELEADLKDSI